MSVQYLWIRTAPSVFISVANTLEESMSIASIAKKTGVGYGRSMILACVENLDSDLVCARGFHLDIFELEWLACTPAYGSLALDHFSFSFRRHDSIDNWHQLGLALSPLDRAPITPISLGNPGRLRTLHQYLSFFDVLPKHLLQACMCYLTYTQGFVY